MRLLRQRDGADQAAGGQVAPTGPVSAREWVLRGCFALLQLLLIGLAAWFASRIPLPLLDNWLPIKNVVIAIIAVTAAGKCLIDTLFYDRFWG